MTTLPFRVDGESMGKCSEKLIASVEPWMSRSLRRRFIFNLLARFGSVRLEW
jgi:hypothetical protein